MRPVSPLVVELYRTRNGRVPLQEWLESIRDRATLTRIVTRLARLREGNLGDHRALGGGIIELRIFHGPGYRIYGAREGTTFIVLLRGGDKPTQRKDIAKAQAFYAEYRRRISTLR